MAKRMTPKAIAVAYLARGVPAVRELDDQHTLTVRQVKTAIKECEKAGADISDLEEWLWNTKGSSFRHRSRRSVQVGMDRIYKAGAHGDAECQTPYIKIPVHTLGAVVGSSITVEFKDGVIECRRTQ